ncbi:unnamed protein product [Effrenium voratum]|nr:unnamed protein product [Effrenium voratum]
MSFRHIQLGSHATDPGRNTCQDQLTNEAFGFRIAHGAGSYWRMGHSCRTLLAVSALLGRARSRCWCGDGTCNSVCTGKVYNYDMPDGFCGYVGLHPRMTDQDKCCACPHWGCAQTWMSGDTDSCDGGLVGTCDPSLCGQTAQVCECWVKAFDGFSCASKSDTSVDEGLSLQQCADRCYGCNGIEYEVETGQCELCFDASEGPPASGRAVWLRSSYGRRLDGLESTTSQPGECGSCTNEDRECVCFKVERFSPSATSASTGDASAGELWALSFTCFTILFAGWPT